jgi:dipeptidyl aminopeptidase/acylaminoacyl peptidase
MAGACYVADVFTCEFEDPQLQARFRGLSRYFQDRRSLAPVSLSADGKLWALSVTGADLPGAYYVLDADKKDVALVGERYPQLPEAALGQAERFQFKARDGTAIPAYLTRPPGAGPGALPTVVLVHGGPQARDSLDFDPLVQFLATRGRQVLEVNFRGSGGYGRAWADAGLRQWGGLMQDDVVDGVKALAATGRADPSRVCIMGGGYGGYAALQAAASQPALFRCAASWSGPSDLPALLRWERKTGNHNYGEHLRAIGDPDADRETLTRASPVNHAADFRAQVLLVHGEQDDVVPADQSRAMAEALQAAGKPVTLLQFEDEGHAEFSEAHMKAMFQAIEDLLARSFDAPAQAGG